MYINFIVSLSAQHVSILFELSRWIPEPGTVKLKLPNTSSVILRHQYSVVEMHKVVFLINQILFFQFFVLQNFQNLGTYISTSTSFVGMSIIEINTFFSTTCAAQVQHHTQVRTVDQTFTEKSFTQKCLLFRTVNFATITSETSYFLVSQSTHRITQYFQISFS